MKTNLLLLLLLICTPTFSTLFAQSVSINVNGAAADTSAILDVSSTSKGFLMPRMSTAQKNAINLPASGLALYNTTTNTIQVNTGNTLSPVWSSFPGIVNYTHTIFTPSTGGTLSLIDNSFNIINPAATLTSLTVTLPSSPANNDIVYIKFTQSIGLINYSGGTVLSGLTVASKGQLMVMVYDSASSKWY